MSTFDHEVQEWSIYKDRLEQWFLANELVKSGEDGDKAGTKRRAILLSSLSESTYKLVRDLASPKKMDTLNYKEILKLLDGHFQIKKCGLHSGYRSTVHLHPVYLAKALRPFLHNQNTSFVLRRILTVNSQLAFMVLCTICHPYKL